MGADPKTQAPDPVGAAIAAADAPTPIVMSKWQVTIDSTGRPAIMVIPRDITESEIAELAGWMLTTLRRSLQVERAQAQPASRLVVARSPLRRI